MDEIPATSNTNNQTETKNKPNIPSIVIDGKTTNQNTLKAIIKVEFSVKHTNFTTIIFTKNIEDHVQVLDNIKNERCHFIPTLQGMKNSTHLSYMDLTKEQKLPIFRKTL